MSYMALYRKFRPREFGDVKGQDHIVTTLKNQIRADRIGHAYLFCGTRGTGKTTIAKILAKAVNCEHPTDGSPCNECASCKAIGAGSSMNVIEIDAASNNGVDNIREIVEEVQYSPAEGKYKVYIIDEVHMLSTGAFNALLKTLEEPPSYVIFILATTEAHKIPITILSRCQRYDFKRISIDQIAERLHELLEEEKIEAEEKAVRYVAKVADGSMRDGLSLLDQCIAFYLGEKLTYDRVLEVLGAVDVEIFGRMYHYLADNEVIAALELLEELVLSGRELAQFVLDFTWYLRNLLLIRTSDQALDIIDVSSEQQEALQKEAELLDVDTIIRYIRVLSDLSNQLRFATQKRVTIEVALIKLCRPAMETSLDSVLDRIRHLEKKVEEGVFTDREAAEYDPPREGQIKTRGRKEEAALAVYPKAIPEDLLHVAESWPMIMSRLPTAVRAMMTTVRPSVGEGNTLLLIFENDMERDYVGTDAHLAMIEEIIKEVIEKEVSVAVGFAENNRVLEDSYVDLTKIINMKVEYEE